MYLSFGREGREREEEEDGEEDWEAPHTDPKVRPVAVGETLRRLAGRFVFSQAPVVASLKAMHPLQIGVAVKGAPENLAGSTQQLVDNMHAHTGEQEWVICN